MKMPWLVAVSFLLAGCDYTVPLASTSSLPMDQSLVGLWEKAGDDGQTEQLLVLPLNTNEIMIAYPAGTAKSMYGRACLVQGAGLTLVQITWLGNGQGEPPDDARIYQLARYTNRSNQLDVGMLNAAVISNSIASSASLLAALEQNKDRLDLFANKMTFKRVGY